MCTSHTGIKVKSWKCITLIFSRHDRRASQTPLCISHHSIVSSPHFLLPQCTSFTAEHRDGASQGGRWRQREGEGQMKMELNACVCVGDGVGRVLA